MSETDPTRPAEERIQEALTRGPDIGAPGRYGAFTRIIRRVVGRAVKYERDYAVQLDVALLDRLHEIEAGFTRQLDDVSAQVRGSDDRVRELREFDEQLLDNDHRAQRTTWGALARIDALEELLVEMRAQLRDADARASVAATLASGTADLLESLGLENELASQPYLRAGHPLLTTDADGRPRLGYRGVTGPSPLGVGFEDLFRGSEVLIRERQRAYLELIAGRGPVVDLGCGRGEMLGLLTASGIEARGVDLDGVVVDEARAAGRDVEHDDALAFLVKQADASLGAIFSAQLIEHLPAALLPELLEVARSKLLPNGVFIAETVNPHSPRALKAFWIDPTHQHPLFPETMLALCRLTGFEEAEVVFALGRGDLETDLRVCAEYAVVARVRELA